MNELKPLGFAEQLTELYEVLKTRSNRIDSRNDLVKQRDSFQRQVDQASVEITAKEDEIFKLEQRAKILSGKL